MGSMAAVDGSGGQRRRSTAAAAGDDDMWRGGGGNAIIYGVYDTKVLYLGEARENSQLFQELIYVVFQVKKCQLLPDS